MTKCCFCKKEYKTYPVLICDKIEYFIAEIELRELYYDDKANEGICKECREAKYKDNIFMIQLWLNVRIKLVLALQRVKAKKDGKLASDYRRAIERVKEEEKKLEQTDEVKALYRANNPAAFMPIGTKKTMCIYCDENYGQKWINNPNGHYNKEEKDKCWWVCIPCAKIIEKQSNLADAEAVKYFLAKQHLPTTEMDKKIDKLQKEIDDIAYEDGSEAFSIKTEKK